MLTGDPSVELNPFTYMLLYTFPQQAHNYPAIAQALPHLQQAQTPPQSPPPSPNSSGEAEFFTLPTNPNTNQPRPGSTTSSKTPKLLQSVLRGGKAVEFQDSLPIRQSWIQKNLSKMQAKY